MPTVKQVALGLFALTILFARPASGLVVKTESFDKPVRKVVRNLGRSRYLMSNDPSRIRLSCFYHPEFMVKELNDPGVKGVLWVTVTPVNDRDLPDCILAHSAKERFIAKEWWGFKGVKGSLVFLEAPDGDANGGMPFRVLDAKTGKRIFEDSIYWNSDLQFTRTEGGNFSLRYTRMVGGDCSIPKDGLDCWTMLRKHYGLIHNAVPNCDGYRHEGDKEWVPGDEGVRPESISTPSAIAYPVVVELFPRPVTTAVPGSVKCSPVP